MEKYDIIIVGGGFAGSGAALAAARGGARVLLVERSNCLGGAPSNMAINPFMRNSTRMNETGEQVELSRGILEEIIRDLESMNAMRKNVFNPEYLKIILNRKMQEAGVKLLFNSFFVSCEKEGKRVKSVNVANKSGIVKLEADYFIDATGDADVAYAAGFPTRLGRQSDNLCQPMTLCFSIAGVDPVLFEEQHYNICKIWLEEKKKGYIKNPMDGIMVFHTVFPGIVQLTATRVIKKNPVDAWELTQAEIEAREQAFELHDFLVRCVPGFENSRILSTASLIGVRESRMIDGEHILTAEELMDCTRFSDSIACGNYDIDIHNPCGSGTSHYFFPEGQYYTIPYRSLIPKDSENLLVAGRCISATHEAQASIRIMRIVCSLGEAAGTAAAIAHRDNVSVMNVDIKKLQNTLVANGAFIG
ncbi:MAG TPA: FAD-dependent oxidoreductase [Clostridiales bacterium]|nr:FAD-dependent oxidoreductase [Clostridiales bacterium]